MKKGEPLKPMLQKIDEDKEHKDDYLVNLKSLKCKEYPFLSTSEVHVKEIYHSLKFAGSFSSGKTKDEVDKPMTDHALGQLCNKLEISTGYIRKCLPFPELVNYNLNKWISHTENLNLMVRCNETNVRAVLSNRYKRLDNDLVAHHTLDKLMDMGAEIHQSQYDGDYLKLTAVTPELEGEVKKGDVVQGGVTITNSEIGTQTLLIQPFLYRLVCTNGMVVPSILNRFYQKHLGKVLIDLERDTQAIKIIHKMKKQLELVNDPKVFQENLQKLKDAEKVKTNSTKIVKLFKSHSVSDSEKAEIYAKLNRNISEPYFETDHYSLANAITNYANSDDISEDRSRFLQELGGLIIFAHNPMAVKLR